MSESNEQNHSLSSDNPLEPIVPKEVSIVKTKTCETSQISKAKTESTSQNNEQTSSKSSVDSKANSLDDSHEFVEANSSFSNETTNQNKDKLMFKDAKKIDVEDSVESVKLEEADHNQLNIEKSSVNFTNKKLTELIANESIEDTSKPFSKKREQENGKISPSEKSAVALELADDLIEKTSNVLLKNSEIQNKVAVEIQQTADKNEPTNDDFVANDSIEDDDDEESKSLKDAKETLDEDEMKSSPAYIPKHGLFYMHDLRNGSSSGGIGDNESCTGAETATGCEAGASKSSALLEIHNRSKISRADRKWEHDLFDDKQQRPKATVELVRCYGHNIRLNTDGKDNVVKENGAEDSGEIDEDGDDESAPEKQRRQRFGVKRQPPQPRQKHILNVNEEERIIKNGNESSRFQRSQKSNKNERRNAPIVNEQRNVPVVNERRNAPVVNERRNVPLFNERRNVPVVNERRNTPVVNERRRRRQVLNSSQVNEQNQSSGESEQVEVNVNKSFKPQEIHVKRQPPPFEQKRIGGFRRTIVPSRLTNLNTQTPPRRSFNIRGGAGADNRNQVNGRINTRPPPRRDFNIGASHYSSSGYNNNENEDYSSASGTLPPARQRAINGGAPSKIFVPQQNNFSNNDDFEQNNQRPSYQHGQQQTLTSKTNDNRQYQQSRRNNVYNGTRHNSIQPNYSQSRDNFQNQQQSFPSASNYQQKRNDKKNNFQNNDNNVGNGYYSGAGNYSQQQRHPLTSYHQGSLRSGVPPQNIRSSNNNANNYLNNFPPLSTNQTHLPQERNQYSNRNLNSLEHQLHLQQPTDVVYFDLERQPTRNLAPLQFQPR